MPLLSVLFHYSARSLEDLTYVLGIHPDDFYILSSKSIYYLSIKSCLHLDIFPASQIAYV